MTTVWIAGADEVLRPPQDAAPWDEELAELADAVGDLQT